MGLIVDSFISISTSLAAFPKEVVSLMGVGANVLIHELSRAKTAAVSCLQVGKAKEEEKENLIHELSTAVMFTGG
jgi:hypothetical protein